MVSESSGSLDPAASIEKTPLERTHFDINKFGRPTEPSYRTVSNTIQRMAHEAHSLLFSRLNHRLLLSDPSRAVSALHDACRRDDIASLQDLISSRSVSVDARSDKGMTPLITTIEHGNRQSFHFLLSSNADIEASVDTECLRLTQHGVCGLQNPIQEGCRPLFLACLKGRESMVEILLKKGAVKEAKTDQGITPLLAAIRCEHLGVIDILLSHGCDIDAATSFTPLIYAAHFGCSSSVGLLLDRGASVEAKNESGMTALLEATRCRRYMVARMLLEKAADIESTAARFDDLTEPTALHIAAARGYHEMAYLLLKHGARADAETAEGLTALDIVRGRCDDRMIRIMDRWTR